MTAILHAALLVAALAAPAPAVPHHPDDHAVGAAKQHVFHVGDHVRIARHQLVGASGTVLAIMAKPFAAEPWVELILDETDPHGHRFWALVPVCALEFAGAHWDGEEDDDDLIDQLPPPDSRPA